MRVVSERRPDFCSCFHVFEGPACPSHDGQSVPWGRCEDTEESWPTCESFVQRVAPIARPVCRVRLFSVPNVFFLFLLSPHSTFSRVLFFFLSFCCSRRRPSGRRRCSRSIPTFMFYHEYIFKVPPLK